MGKYRKRTGTKSIFGEPVWVEREGSDESDVWTFLMFVAFILWLMGLLFGN